MIVQFPLVNRRRLLSKIKCVKRLLIVGLGNENENII